ncbi:MAG: FimB/Mfa2 family fimbrial subunit [Bacteroidales bacterium]|nr:FimB/Mfa2 family fimbrial subunit [Bacteroidales bacterium]
MKRINFLTSVCAAAALLAACDAATLAPALDGGAITIEFAVPEATRAVAQGNEATISDVQLLLFNQNGSLYKFHSLTASEISAKSASLTNVLNGNYTVYVVANGPDLSGKSTLESFLATAIDLETCNSPSSDFVMEGHGDVTVSGSGTTNISVSISRYVSRVVLKSITNGLPSAYGSLTVDRVFLSNAVRVQEIGGDCDPGNTPGNWYNKEGRKDESTRNAAHIINGSTYTASAPALTFATIGTSLANGGKWNGTKYFYAYPNDSAANPDGFKEPFAAQKSVLVIVGTFGGNTYYYPVILRNGMDRNTSYEISATITGAGSDDPNKPVTSGSLRVTVSIDNWIDGTTYTETF